MFALTNKQSLLEHDGLEMSSEMPSPTNELGPFSFPLPAPFMARANNCLIAVRTRQQTFNASQH